MNDFITADLSTYNPKATLPFYQQVFTWDFYDAKTGDGTHVAYLGNQAVASIYQTPKQFQAMGMPHFWMSYIAVDSVAETVAKARALGGIIELEQTLTDNDMVALIRDPQGAGFTVYEGNSLAVTRTENQANTLIWNELHVSDVKKVLPFYQGIFAWQIEPKDNKNEHWCIIDTQGKTIGNIIEIPNEIKGKYEYWVCTFGVSNLKHSKEKILSLGGTVVMDEGKRVLVTDNSGEAFFYISQTEAEKATAKQNQPDNQTDKPPVAKVQNKPIKYKAMLGLGLIAVSLLLEQYWLFAVFFLIWLVMDLRTGTTHLFESVSKQQNPILYWLIMGTWGLLSVFSLMV